MEYGTYMALSLVMGALAVGSATNAVKDLMRRDFGSAAMAAGATIGLLLGSSAPMKVYRHEHASSVTLEKRDWQCSVARRTADGNADCLEYRRK